MNRKVSDVLDRSNRAGDVLKYFEEMDDILERNSGVNDNKTLTSDAAEPPCPIYHNTYTKIKITDDAIHITNIDKSTLTAKVKLHLQPTSNFWEKVLNEEQEIQGNVDEEQVEAENLKRQNYAFARTYRNRITKWFVGFKASIHSLDAYRIYSYNKKTNCEQTEALYENAVIRMLKPQEELDEKPGIYTLWKRANVGDDCVCGTYFTLEDVLTKSVGGIFTVEFEIAIPLDDFLPLSAFTMYPNKVFENLSLEVKMGIQQNIVICQVDPVTEFERLMKTTINGSEGAQSALLNHLRLSIGSYTRHFTQCGDPAVSTIYKINQDGTVDDVSVETKFVCTKGELLYLRSNINGFNVKDSVLQHLRDKYREKPLIIPAQYCDYQAFSQKPSQTGLKCNTTYGMTNVSSLMFIFPRTHNEITCCQNPHLSSIQLQIDNKPYPDKNFSTLEPAHTMFNLVNTGLDSLFSPSEEFSYSMTYNEMKESTQFKYKKVGENGHEENIETDGEPVYSVVAPYKDNTSYCFVCSTERLSGYGNYCDGLTKDNAHITLTASLQGASDVNPYYTHPIKWHEAIESQILPNDRSPVMIICQDCFWILRTDKTAEFVNNDKYFYDQMTGEADEVDTYARKGRRY